MAWQLIYTSAPRGLVAGRSGFCTVARHREIRDGLVTAVERFSQYDRAGRASGTPSPVVYAHRIVRLGGAAFHVLSRTIDAGADYTGRTNHLAHHLICEPGELASAPSPAEVLTQMDWLRAWTDAPRYFGAEEAVDLRRFPATAQLPAQSWEALTGDAGCAALPLESGALAGSTWLYAAEAADETLLPFFAESLLLLDAAADRPEKRWQVPFTTYLQGTDQAADFFWRGCRRDSPSSTTTQSVRQIFDFSQPQTLRAPENATAELARHGRVAEPEPAAELEDEPELTPWPTESAPPAAKLEVDLAELLASADSSAPATFWAKAKALAPSPKTQRASLPAEPRQRSLKLLGIATVAVLLFGGGTLLFSFWRQGKVDELSRQLSAVRKTGEFARARGLAKGEFVLFRNQEPLKSEIERAGVAADLHELSSAKSNEADAYLTANAGRFARPAIQDDPQIQALRAEIKRWIALEQQAASLARRLTDVGASSGELQQEVDGIESAAKTLETSHRESIAALTLMLRRALVERRLLTIEREADSGVLPEPEELLSVTNDAKRYASSPEIQGRLGHLHHRLLAPRRTSTNERDAPLPPPPTPGPASIESARAAADLPSLPTYLGVVAGRHIDVSGIDEMRAWTALPSTPVRLYRQPDPPLNPPKAGSVELSVSGGRLYDQESKSLLNLQQATDAQPALVLDEKARNLMNQFGLVFNESAQPFYLYCGAGDGPLIRVPTAPWLGCNQAKAILTLKRELVTALARIKLASSGAPRFVLRGQRLGECEFAVIPSPSDEPLPIAMAAKIAEIEQAAAARTAAGTSKPKTHEDQVREAKTARDILMGKEELETHLSDAGLALFPELESMTKSSRLATTVNFLIPEPGSVEVKRETLPRGRAYAVYTQKLLVELSRQIDGEIAGIKSKAAKLNATKKKEKDEIDLLDKQRAQLVKQRSLADAIVEDFGLEETQPLNGPRLDKVVEVWRTCAARLGKFEAGPAKLFAERWAQIFTPENIKKIMPFMRWDLAGTNDGELDIALRSLSSKKPPAEPEPDRLGTLAARMRTDFMSLGPFWIELRSANGSPIRVVEFTEVASAHSSAPAHP